MYEITTITYVLTVSSGYPAWADEPPEDGPEHTPEDQSR